VQQFGAVTEPEAVGSTDMLQPAAEGGVPAQKTTRASASAAPKERIPFGGFR